MPREPDAWIAEQDTRNFHFEGHGRTEVEALAALDRAFILHGRQYNLPDDWAAQCGATEDIKTRPILLDSSWRDGEELEGEQWG